MGYFGDTIYVDGLSGDLLHFWVEQLESYGYSFQTYLESYGRYEVIEIDTRSVGGKDFTLESILTEMTADGATITFG